MIIDDVLVIGAGPAGLTTAYELLKHSSQTVTVLEADPTYVGGISRTEKYKGYAFDIGGHRFFSKSQRVVAFWKETLPHDFLLRNRLSRIFYGGQFYSYPLKAFEALKNLGLWESGLCFLSYVRVKIRPLRPEKSFRAWVSNRFGSRLFSIFFKSYTEKVWGLSCDEISADWAAQRIRGLNLTKAVLSGLRRSLRLRGKSSVKTLIEEFHYPRLGPGMMWEQVAKNIQALNGKLVMGVRAQRFEWSADEKIWTVEAVSNDGTTQLYKARHLVSSAPLAETIPNIYPRPPSADDALKLSYRDFLTVALLLPEAPSFQDNWIYIHDPKVKVGRIQNFVAWSPAMVPHPGTGCLGMEYFCFENDSLWNTRDQDLIELAKREILSLKLIPSSQTITDGCVVRQPKAYPVYDDHYKSYVQNIRRDIKENYPTFHMIGRNGMHKYNNQDHSMMTGFLTAENILAGFEKHDVWNVNEDAEYHEEGSSSEAGAASGLRLTPQKIIIQSKDNI